jgi:hypothetical protein
MIALLTDPQAWAPLVPLRVLEVLRCIEYVGIIAGRLARWALRASCCT